MPTVRRAASGLHPVAGPLLLTAITETIAAQGRCRLALSGGSTPGETLAWLADHLPAALYPRLWVTWADERAVPRDDPRANLWLAEAQWLSRAPGRPAKILPLTAAPETLLADRDACEAALNKDFGGAVDVVLLGVGEDGHVASLFPGHPALDTVQRVAAVADSPKPPPARLTLTLPVLRAAPHVLVLARGAEKADALARAWAGHGPLGRLPHACWVVDAAAAAALPADALHPETETTP